MNHAPLAPSSSYRWIECPASVNLSENILRESNEACELGSLMHEIASRILRNMVSRYNKLPIPKDKLTTQLDVRILVSEYNVTNEDDMSSCIYMYVSYIESHFYHNVDIRIENRCEIIPEACYGTYDALILDPNTNSVKVIDFKTGITPVSSRRNYQLMCYLLGSINISNSVVLQNVNCRFFGAIAQPNAIHSLKVSEYTYEELQDFKCKIMWSNVLRINHKHATNPSKFYKKNDFIEGFKESDALSAGSHCRWCPANSRCETAAKKLIPIKDSYSGKLPVPDDLDDDTLKKIIKNKSAVIDFLNNVEDRAATLLSCGIVIPGLELTKKRTCRRWISSDEVLDHIKLKAPEKYKNCFNIKVKSISEVVKIFDEDFVKPHIYKPEGGLTVRIDESEECL